MRRREHTFPQKGLSPATSCATSVTIPQVRCTTATNVGLSKFRCRQITCDSRIRGAAPFYLFQLSCPTVFNIPNSFASPLQLATQIRANIRHFLPIVCANRSSSMHSCHRRHRRRYRVVVHSNPRLQSIDGQSTPPSDVQSHPAAEPRAANAARPEVHITVEMKSWGHVYQRDTVGMTAKGGLLALRRGRLLLAMFFASGHRSQA